MRSKVLGKVKVLIREATLEDIPGLLVVEEEAWRQANQRANAEMIESRIMTFSRGVLIAETEGEIWGYVVVQRLDPRLLYSNGSLSWASITDNGMIKSTHNPKGTVFYGVNLSVSAAAPSGTAFVLMESVGKLAIKLNIREVCLGGRMPGYHRVWDKYSADEYLALKVKNRPRDPEVRLYSEAGLRVVKAIPNFFPDPESCDYGVLLSWSNPFYGKPVFVRWILSKLFKI